MSLWALFRCVVDYALYALNLVQATFIHQRIYRQFFCHLEPKELQQWVGQFFKETTLTYHQECLERLRKALKENVPVILLSSSPDFLVEPLGKKLRVTHCIATHYGNQGVEVIVGEAKTAAASQLTKDLSKCVAYADHLSDLPFLERVGKPVVVAPNGRLSRLANSRGWEVIDAT